MESQERSWADAMRAERAGDGIAYERFLEELAVFLRGIVRYRMGHLGLNAGEAEDVVQEVLIAVHMRRSQWDPSRPLLPWLNAIARYKVVDAARRLRKELGWRVHLGEDGWSSLPGAEPEGRDITAEDVDRLVSGLPSGQQSVVRAIGVEGASPREAADRLGMSEGSVRVAFHRGLNRLMKAARNRRP